MGGGGLGFPSLDCLAIFGWLELAAGWVGLVFWLFCLDDDNDD